MRPSQGDIVLIPVPFIVNTFGKVKPVILARIATILSDLTIPSPA